ncbi:MAG: two-component regulator propeller domain-containing protein [Bacteroidota bacterium]
MGKLVKTFLVLASVFLLVGDLRGQGNNLERPYYRFHRLSEEQGLSNNMINDIIQDHIGFIWVATEDGLFRYDGNEFLSYRHEPGNPFSLPHNSVQSLYCDEQNKIWVLTDYGIGIYQHQTDQIKQILPGSEERQLPHKSVTSISSSSSGTKFLGTFGGGLIIARNDSFRSLLPAQNPDSLFISGQLITQVHLDQDSVLWIGTWNDGLMQLDLKYNILRPVPLASEYPMRVYTIYPGQDKQLWVGTNQGLFVFSESSINPQHFSMDSHDSFPDDEILSIMEDDRGIMWMGTRNAGLFSVSQTNVFDQRGPQIHRFEPSNAITGVSHRTIAKIFQDKAGKIWLGTHNAGINVFDPKGEAVKSFTYIPDGSGLSHQSVWGIVAAEDSHIWVGTDGGGLNLLQPYALQVQHLPSIGLSDKAILCALNSQSGKIFLGTYAGGLNVYDPQTRQNDIFDTRHGLQTNDIRSLLETQSGDIWIGTNGGGLHLFDIQNQTIQHIDSTWSLDIRDIVQEQDGTLWLGTFGDGLVRYQPKDNSIRYFNWHATGKYTPVALSIHLEGNNIWVGTRQSGLQQFDILQESFQPMAEFSGNYTIRAIVPDQLGHLWISTNGGISCFFRSPQRYQNYDSSHGFQIGQFNDGSALMLPNGDLVFGGIHGIVIFSPKDLLAQRRPPKTIFTKLTVHERKVKSAQSLPVMDGQTLSLPFTQNTFTLAYNAISFPNSDSWNYDYRLGGYDTDWNENEHLRSVTYRNLPPGTYNFDIRSVDPVSKLKGEMSTIQLRILAPWYRTWAAYLFYALFLVWMIYLGIGYNNRQIKLKQSLIYEQKLRHQENLDIQQKLRFFTNFSHELRTPLTLIQGPVNDLLKQESLHTHRPLLRLIKRNSTQLLKLVNRLLEFRKIETKKIILNIDHYDLSILAQEEGESFGYQAGKLGIDFHLQSDQAVYGWVDIEKVQIILNNLLSNAIKYTPEGGRITFSLRNVGEAVQIEVADTGPGIPSHQREAIFMPFFQADNSSGKGGTGIGLALTKSLVELHSGKIKVQSGPNGSKFTIQLPNNKAAYIEKNYVQFISQTTDPEIEEAESEKAEGPAYTSPVVLVVDDHADIVAYVQEHLKSNYTVLSANDGKKALELAIQELPDLIISDIMMPGLNGIEVCTEIKANEKTNHIPIILLTAKAEPESKVEGYQSGADSYLTKPFSSQVLMARVENLLKQRKQLSSLFASGKWEEQSNIEDSPELRFIRQAEQTIIDMMEETEVSVPKLARELGYSRTSLYRKIKTLTGLSINKFIRLVKMKRAAQMLANEDVTVSEIAFLLGFTDLKYFRKCFKDQYELLPSEYRKQHYRRDISIAEIRESWETD